MLVGRSPCQRRGGFLACASCAQVLCQALGDGSAHGIYMPHICARTEPRVQRCVHLVVCLLLCLQEDTSLSKVHTLFRQLGLRHLAVIPRASCVMGVITRHDLLPGALEETFMGQQAPLGAGEQIISINQWYICSNEVHGGFHASHSPKFPCFDCL
jgi:hypothetical protein